MGLASSFGIDDSLFLRCIFAAPEELRARLRPGPRGQLLLLVTPGELALPASGTSAFLDVSFASTGEHSLLRGTVVDVEPDGLLLSLPQAHLAASWMDRVGARRRRHPRFACDLLAELRDDAAGGLLCRVEDLGLGGLSLRCGVLSLPRRADRVRFAVLARGSDDLELDGRVAWAAGGGVGISLEGPLPQAWFALVAMAEARWLRAPLVAAVPGQAAGDEPAGEERVRDEPVREARPDVRRRAPEASASPIAG